MPTIRLRKIRTFCKNGKEVSRTWELRPMPSATAYTVRKTKTSMKSKRIFLDRRKTASGCVEPLTFGSFFAFCRRFMGALLPFIDSKSASYYSIGRRACQRRRKRKKRRKKRRFLYLDIVRPSADPEQHKTAFKTSGNAAEQQERTQANKSPCKPKNSRKSPIFD